MADIKPTLTINGHNYAAYVEELTPGREQLDAEGSGRDVQTGTMFRTYIAKKQKYTVKMLRLQASTMMQLLSDVDGAFYQATIVSPETNTQVTKTFYTASVNCGAQRYNKETGAPYYDGCTFTMTEQ